MWLSCALNLRFINKLLLAWWANITQDSDEEYKDNVAYSQVFAEIKDLIYNLPWWVGQLKGVAIV